MQAILQATWKRIEAGLASHAPGVLSKLQPGASDEAIRQAEQALGMEFPEEVRASYRIHNGSNGAGLTEDGRLLSLEEIVAEWDMNMTILYDYSLDEKELQPEKDRAIQNAYWHRKWIPLIMDGGGDAICVDLLPGPAGQQGQMILFVQGTMSRLVLATGWQRYLARFADGLEAGKYALGQYGELECREGFEENRAIGSN